MAYDIGPKIGIEGEAEFRKELGQINQNIKTLGSEMKAVVSSFEDGANSQEAMAAKTDVLNRQVEEQRKKLDKLNEGLAAAVEKFGESDTRTQKWRQAVYEATAQLNKMEQGLSEADNEMDDLSGGMKDAEKKTLSFSDVLKSNLLGDAIKSGLKAVASGIKEIAGAMKDAVVDSAAYADEILTLSTNTGLSTDTLQELSYMAELTDTSLDTITGSMTKLIKNMTTASKGTGDAAEAFNELGVSIKDSNGEMRDNEEVFYEVLEALSGIENETQRDAYAMSIFGRSAQELNSFMAQGADGIAALAQEAHNVGYVLDSEALSALGGVDDAMQRFDRSTTALKTNLASRFAPAIATVIEGFNDFIAGQTDVQTFVSSVSGMVVQAANGILANLPALVSAGGQIFTSLLSGLQDVGPTVINVALEVLDILINGLLTGLPTLIETGASMLVSLATGIAERLPELIPLAVSAVLQLVETLTSPDVLVSLIDAGLQLVVSLAEGLVNAVPELIKQIPVIIENLVMSLVESAPKVLEAGVQLIVALGLGLIKAIPELIMSIPKIITAIVNGLTEGIKKIIEVGKNIVSGVWEGIKSMAQWIKDKVSGFFSGIVDSVKGLLGIKSPSRVFAGIGGYMAEGLGVGFDKEIGAVQKNINRSMADLVPNVSGTVSLTGRGSVSGSAVGFSSGDLRNALSGMGIYMSGQRVGELTTIAQRNNARAMGTA